MSKKLTATNAIILHLSGELEEHQMTEAHQLKLQRVIQADDFFRQYYSMNRVVKMLLGKYKMMYAQREPKINYTIAMAKKDYVDSRTVFNPDNIPSRKEMLDVLLDNIATSRRLAIAKGDVNNLVKCDTNLANAIKLIEENTTQEIQVPEMLLSYAPKSLEGIEEVNPDELKKQISNLLNQKKETFLEDAEEVTPEKEFE